MNLFLLCSLGLQTLNSLAPTQKPAAPVPESPIVVLKREALALEPLVASALAKDFLKATSNLPAIPRRTVYLDEAAKTYKTESAGAPLSKDEKSKLKSIELDESFYWTTKYGSPLAYTRPLDVLGRYGLKNVSGLKILDFGYGSIGHLRLLASLGANVTGIDVDPLLHALYSAQEDQGLVKNPQGRDGKVRLIDGRFPADSGTTAEVGGDYDLIISKEVWEAAGFRVIAYDQDDSEAARAIGHALGWDQGSSPIDLKSDLFAKYSLMEKSRDGNAP